MIEPILRKIKEKFVVPESKIMASSIQYDLLDSALKSRDVDYVRLVELDVLQNWKNAEIGNSAFAVAARNGSLSCCEEILKRCPSLFYQTSNGGGTALHTAVYNDRREVIKFLLSASVTREECGDIESGITSHDNNNKKLLTMVTKIKQSTALHLAVEKGYFESVKLLIEADPSNNLLRMVDKNGDTALHMAVKNNNLQIVKLLVEADPDFEYCTNAMGRTPVFIAFQEALTGEKDMFKLLLEIAPIQSKTPIESNKWSILHYAASKGDLSSVADILRICPDCSEVVDNEGRNFLHIAAKFEHIEVVRLFVLETKEVASNVLNGQDNDGNTPLNIAALSENEAITLCLLSDPRVDIKLTTVTTHLHWAVRTLNIEIMKILIDADPDFFKGIEKDVLLNSRDGDGESILSKAVQENYLYWCKEICNRCPSLIYHQSRNGKTPLHYAARKGDPKMVKCLISAGAETNFENKKDIESTVDINPNTKLLIMVDEQGDTALHNVVLNHKLEAVKQLIEADPDIVYSANNSGETPLSIAIREARSHENRLNTGKIRKWLLEMQPSQSKARRGENGWTSLHHAAYDGDLSAVEDIINFCPDCLELVDTEGMNFFHIAAKFQHIQVVKHVLGLGGKKVPDNVLNMQDNNGNTPLHIAALSGNESLALCLLYDNNVDKMTVNKNGQHVLHTINFDYDKRKAGVRGVTDQVDQKDLKDQSDFDLVVGALIATVSFTAGITVPGGYISDGPNKGTAVLSEEISFEVFVISNTFALLFSLYAVFSHYCARRLVKTEDILHQLKVATFCTLGAIYAMMAAFIAGSFAVLSNSSRLAILVCAICSCFFILACRPIWKIVMQERRSAHNGSVRQQAQNAVSDLVEGEKAIS